MKRVRSKKIKLGQRRSTNKYAPPGWKPSYNFPVYKTNRRTGEKCLKIKGDVPPPQPELSRYESYMRSEAWKKKRREYWSSSFSTDCYCCGRPRHIGMHLHHRTYRNLGNENLVDLVPVCEPCHDVIHGLHKENPRQSLWKATDLARDQIRALKKVS